MEIAEIKQRLTIEKVLQYYGLQANRNHMLKCPFHEETEPSLKIYPNTNTFNCFGCKANGDTIEFIQLKEKCSKHEALKKATELINPIEITKQSNQAPPEPVSRNGKIELLTKLFGYFRGAINNSKPSRNYITQTRRLELFLEIGYNSAQFHHGQRRDEALINECVKYGMLTPTQSKTKAGNSTGYYVFGKNCIVFPLKDKEQNITGLYFRSIEEKKDSKHYYLKDREGLYPGYLKQETTRLIITEAIIDAATLLQLPFITEKYEVLSCYGTNGFTSEHKEAIKELANLQEVIIFFDGDKTGITAAEKLAKEIQKLNDKLTIKIVNTPEGEDVNSLSIGHESEIFTHLLETAQPFFILSEETENTEQAEEPKPTTATKLNAANPEQIIYETSELKITIWGGIEKENLSRLKISMHIKSKANKYKSFRDDVNLYSHGNTQKLIQNISETLEVSTTAITKTITELTEELEAYRLEERTAMAKALKPKLYEMSEEEKQEAQSFLKNKGLGKRTLELIQQSGLIGEEKNGLLLYFLYTSRLMEEPLHAIIFGKSGSGKTYLQTKISECLPEESVRTITSLTENTLYYSAKGFWKHKVLLIEDLEGVYNAFLPLREFMSKQSITKLTTDKDAKGNNIQKLLTVEGPICVSGATTQGSIYEDNANRSFLLHIDESSNHLNQVMEYQRKIQAGIVNETGQQSAKLLLKNAQRLLRKVKVINPYATDLRIPDCVFKKLRTNMHYLKLIEIITFYNQFQRKWKKSQSEEYYIETAIEDIELANWLVKDNLLRKSDELNEDTRHFFESLKELAAKKPKETQSFYAKEIRQHFRMNPMKVNRYLHQLESRGYINRIGGNRKTGYEYEVAAWEEYELLKSNIDVLDEIIQNIRAKYNGKSKAENKYNTSVTQV
ncbi:CHC2 zinc finger domain-containing protein [Marinilabilia sp.]|uniref:CHC2 zinc finger domain-containing protein n=1 Tax=Marinilabilia sp. TaxID=2021252 RepID=UPI0025BACA82|nr:CHC2 zinc finger domain-containing protein [Marinilabilia sp.]